ncbi:MAG: hypothetical protein Q8N60_03045 [Candidatus Diapherotrites archaeon]|nr:hypothetical protein [Candidatus Diapherotrites archaeon]
MHTLKIQLEERKAGRFREIAMQTFGYSKGSLSKAADAAIDDWTRRIEINKGGADIEKMDGLLKGIRFSSVELQHKMPIYLSKK